MKPLRSIYAAAASAASLLFLHLSVALAAPGPSWWIARGVLNTNATPNDFAAVTQGQVKNMASNAWVEMNANLPGGAGATVSALIGSFSRSNDYLAANIGQLKFVAQPFYDRLMVVGYTDAYPWASSTTTNDYATANIGQLKNLFAWDLTYSTYNDGIPDWWRMKYFGTTATNNQTCASCDYVAGSALDNLQDYECGFDPRVAVHITTPTSVYSGTTNTASIPSAGPGVSYSWTVSNGAITSGSSSTAMLWSAGNAGSATLAVTMTGSAGCNATISTNIAVIQSH
ncbi:MAG TPA: hypothetical protein VMV72_19625 [Verrucomicrobiae bacterium]|nr:hypothetical protein [Verrucomicrobiae bacterium]